MRKQVEKSHYAFARYLNKPRWASVWHQVDEVSRLAPSRVLEIGPGPGVFKAVMKVFEIHVETLDIDPELRPDHVASVFNMPFDDGMFDAVCAFQMLEHLPFDKSLEAFKEMVRVASRNVLISLPDAASRWRYSIHVPKFGQLEFSVPRPRLRPPVHEFDGEHYWEINKDGFPLKHVLQSLHEVAPVSLERTYRVHEHLYHRFFVFTKMKQERDAVPAARERT